jgi:SAM-dependent methyltransferase
VNLCSDDAIRPTLAYYNDHAEEFVRRTQDVDMRPLRKAFTDWLPAGARILDAGCGSGRDAAAFLQEGFDVTAFDGSTVLAEIASRRTGLSVSALTFADVKFDREFDGIWACASLLHLPPDSLDGAVERLTTALKADGTIFMSFKDGEGELIEDGRFTALMTEPALLGLVARHPRLELLRAWTTSDAEGRPANWRNVLARRASGCR